MPIEKLRLYQRKQAGLLPENYDINEIQISPQTTPTRVLDCLDAFLASPKKVLLVDGAALTGKTSLCHWLQIHVGLDYQQGHWLPIYIPLSTQGQSKTLVEDALRCRGLTREEILTARKLPLLLILDGYDELGETQNLYVTQQLHRWSQAKTIITSRSLYLINQPLRQLLFTPFYHERALAHLLESSELAPLSPQQIQVKIKQALINDVIDETCVVYDMLCIWIQQHPSLSAALLSPIFSNTFIQVLSELKHQQRPMGEINTILLQTFVQCWLNYHQNTRLLNPISHTNFPQSPSLENYMIQLARQISAFTGRLPLKFLSRDLFEEPQNTLSDMLFDWDDYATRAAFAQCPIQLVHGQHIQFLHEAFVDNLMAQCEVTATHHLLLVRTREKLPSIEYQAMPMLKDRLERDPFNLTSYVHDNHIISFLADSLSSGDTQSCTQQARFLRFLHQSKKNPALTTAAANAMTILNAAHYDFSHQRLRHIHVSGAYLPSLVAIDTDFEGADFRHCTLIGAYLTQSRFYRANMLGVIWGEMGNLLWTNGKVTGLLFIKENKELLAWGGRNTIALYDLSNEANSPNDISELPTISFSHHSATIRDVIYSPANHTIVSTSKDKTIRILDLKTQVQRILVNKNDHMSTYTMAFNACETAIIYAKNEFTGYYVLHQQSLAEGSSPISLGIKGYGKVRQMQFLSDTQLAVAVTMRRHNEHSTICIYDLPSKTLLATLPGYKLAVSSDKQQMAIASFDATHQSMVRLYNLVDMSLLYILEQTHMVEKRSEEGSCISICDLQYVPKAHRLLCTAGIDGYVLFWDTHSRRQSPLLRIHAHTLPISAMAFSTDGQILTTVAGLLKLPGYAFAERVNLALYAHTGDVRLDYRIRFFAIHTLLSQQQLTLDPQSAALINKMRAQIDVRPVVRESGVDLRGAVFESTHGLSSFDRWLLKSKDAIVPGHAYEARRLVDQAYGIHLRCTRMTTTYEHSGKCYITYCDLKTNEPLPNHDYISAIRLFTAALSLTPKCYDAYFGRALAYKYLDKFNEAEDDFTRAIYFSPPESTRNSFYERGQFYFVYGKMVQAHADLKMAHRLIGFTELTDTHLGATEPTIKREYARIKAERLIHEVNNRPVHTATYNSTTIIDAMLIHGYRSGTVDFSQNIPASLLKTLDKLDVSAFIRKIAHIEIHELFLRYSKWSLVTELYQNLFFCICQKISAIMPLHRLIRHQSSHSDTDLPGESNSIYVQAQKLYDMVKLLIHNAEKLGIAFHSSCLQILKFYEDILGPSCSSTELVETFEHAKQMAKNEPEKTQKYNGQFFGNYYYMLRPPSPPPSSPFEKGNFTPIVAIKRG